MDARPCVIANLRMDWDWMPKTRVLLYCEEDDICPFLQWLDELPVKVQAKCLLRLVVAHRIVKEHAVPPKEINRAIQSKKRFEANPSKHSRSEEISG